MDPGRFVRFALPVLAVLLLGVVLRVLGYFDPAMQLWLDEASWAEMLVNGTGTWIRPAGYMTLSGWLLSFANTEPMLRSVSFVAGFALLLVMNPVFRRTTTTNALVVFGLYLLAIHPSAISMAKEFKPYALEAAVHAVLILFVVRWLGDHRRRDLHAFLVVAVAAPFFAWSVVFAYPGLFLLVALETWRRGVRRDFVVAFVGGVLTLGVLVIIFAMRLLGEDEKTGFWGNKYGVFYVGRSVVEGIGWYLQKTFEVAGFPGRLALGLPAPLTSSVEVVLPALTAVLVLVSLVVLIVRRRTTTLAIWALPWVFTVVFNLLGKWPYGVFRTNLYLLIYTLGLLIQGLEELASSRAWSSTQKRAGVVALVVVGAIVFPWNLDHFRIKEERSMALSTSVRTAVEQILVDAPATGPVDIVFDAHSCGIFRYYQRLHDETHDLFTAQFSSPRFRVTCGGWKPKQWMNKLDAGLHSPTAYVVVAKPPFADVTREAVAARCATSTETRLPGTTQWYRCAPKASAAIAAPAPSSTPTPTPDSEDVEGSGP